MMHHGSGRCTARAPPHALLPAPTVAHPAPLAATSSFILRKRERPAALILRIFAAAVSAPAVILDPAIVFVALPAVVFVTKRNPVRKEKRAQSTQRGQHAALQHTGRRMRIRALLT